MITITTTLVILFDIDLRQIAGTSGLDIVLGTGKMNAFKSNLKGAISCFINASDHSNKYLAAMDAELQTTGQG